MFKSLLYVSRKTTPWPDDGPDVEAITEVARSRNADLDVTGALISTERHFAQILEGPAAAVDEVMVSILRDPRHSALKVLEEVERPRRWFAKWSLAYAGHASYVGLRVAPLVAQAEPDPGMVERLVKLIRTFARTA